MCYPRDYGDALPTMCDDGSGSYPERRCSRQYVEELKGSSMKMQCLSCSRRQPLFDHMQCQFIDQIPTITSLSPTIMFRVPSTDRGCRMISDHC
jgi:hypothetical protein